MTHNQPHDPLPFLYDRLAHEKAKLANATRHENTEPLERIIRETENVIAWVNEKNTQITRAIQAAEDYGSIAKLI